MTTNSKLALPSGAQGAEAQAAAGMQRIERVAAFAREVGDAIAAEFPDVLAASAAVGAADATDAAAATAADPGAPLRAALGELHGRLAATRAFLDRLGPLGPTQRLEAVKNHDLALIQAAVQGVERAAGRLRADATRAQIGLVNRPGGPATFTPQALPQGPQAPPRPAAPARMANTPLPPPPGGRDALALGGGVSARSPRTTSRLGGAPLPPPPGAPRPGPAPAVTSLPAGQGAGAPPAPPRLSELMQARQAFEAARTLVAEVLEFVAPRLLLVKVSLVATGLPGKKKPWEVITQELLPAAQAAGVPQPQMLWLPLLVKLFYVDMPAVQRAHMALVQWDQAQAMHGDAGRVHEAIEAEPEAEPKHKALLRGFDLGRYRAAIYPLSHLYVGFKGMPHLSELFPDPRV